MRGLIKGTIIFALGAGLGVLGSAGFFFNRAQKACNDFEEKRNKELDEIRAMYDSTQPAAPDEETPAAEAETSGSEA